MRPNKFLFVFFIPSLANASDWSGLVNMALPYIIGVVLVLMAIIFIVSWYLSSRVVNYEKKMALRFLPLPTLICISGFYFGFHFILVAPLIITVMALLVRFSFGGYNDV